MNSANPNQPNMADEFGWSTDNSSAESVADAQLLAYLDGALDEPSRAVQEALVAQNEDLRRRLGNLAREQIELERALRHLHAPTPQALGEYALGLCSAEEERALEAQMCDYPHHAYEANQLRHALAQLVPREWATATRTRPLRSLVARLVTASGVAVGVRGEESAQRLYEAGGTQIILEVQPDAQPPTQPSAADASATQHTILGLVLADSAPSDGEESGSATGAVQLFQGERLIASAEVDAAGNFVLPHLPIAIYDLVVSDGATDILISDIVV